MMSESKASKATQMTAGDEPSVTALRVRSLSPSGRFRRAGRSFGVHPTVIPLAELSADEVDQLTAEPMLLVERVVITSAA